MNKSNLCNSSSWGIQLPIQLQFCATLAVSISVSRSKTFATHTHIRSHLHSAKICDAFSMTHHSPIRTRAYRVCHGIGGSPIDIRVFWMRGIACPVPIHISPGMIWPHCVRCAIQSNNVQIRKFIWRWLCSVCVCVWPPIYLLTACVWLGRARLLCPARIFPLIAVCHLTYFIYGESILAAGDRCRVISFMSWWTGVHYIRAKIAGGQTTNSPVNIPYIGVVMMAFVWQSDRVQAPLVLESPLPMGPNERNRTLADVWGLAYICAVC